MVLLVLLQLLWLWPMATASTARTGCQEKCGNITVPYPFGIGDANCYRKLYDVTCNHSFIPPKLFLGKGKVEVLNISSEGQLRINSTIGFTCYDRSGDKISEHLSWIDLKAKPYTFSDTYNRFTALGCDTIATITGSKGCDFKTGCSMLCNSIDNVINGSCSGIGCCQTSIPKGFKKFDLELGSNNNHTDVVDFNWCSYGFLVDHEWYNFSGADLSLFSTRHDTQVPLVLNWAIEGFGCGNASTSDLNYACGNNSECINSPNGLGYLCRCSPGYQGNPYLKDGCQGRD
uniref:EGF-like domain-containing protein n=1 Tax=Nelumbo nucifera TaxID=4432 RepID=A0A822ZCJ8_NELNU|nr:TPA_asm: hypothetical protein HUJ06_000867 [Nelumbo nucifera]DAD42638.1 TPA_asm: hypothetical protein HUJ06_000868 [Nelumbo nucifera]